MCLCGFGVFVFLSFKTFHTPYGLERCVVVLLFTCVRSHSTLLRFDEFTCVWKVLYYFVVVIFSLDGTHLGREVLKR